MVRFGEGGGTNGRHVDARRGDRPRRSAYSTVRGPPSRRRFRLRSSFGGQVGRTSCASCRGEAMSGDFSARTRWAIVITFAIAMAWVESASVFYIRALVDRIEPYQPNPLPLDDALGYVELWREAATLVMLATLGMLAGRTWRRRVGYAALAF